jgi:hypothetical protein
MSLFIHIYSSLTRSMQSNYLDDCCQGSLLKSLNANIDLRIAWLNTMTRNLQFMISIHAHYIGYPRVAGIVRLDHSKSISRAYHHNAE